MKIKFRVIFSSFLSIVLVFGIISVSGALPKNIDDQVNQAQQELENASALVKQVAKELADIRAKLVIAEAQLKKANSELAAAKEKDRLAAEKLAELENQLAITQGNLDETQGFVADVARDLYLQGPLATLDLLLEATDPNDFTQKLMAMQTYVGNQNVKLAQLATIKAQLQKEQSEVEAQKIILEEQKAIATTAAQNARNAEEAVALLVKKQKAALAKAESEKEATRKRGPSCPPITMGRAPPRGW